VPSAQRHVKEIWAKRRKGERKMKKAVSMMLFAMLIFSTVLIAVLIAAPITKCEDGEDPVRPLLFVNGKWTPFTDSPGYDFGEFPCNTEWLNFTVNVTWFQPPNYPPSRTADVTMKSSISGTVFSPSTFQLNNYDHQYEMVSVSVPIAGSVSVPTTYYAWIGFEQNGYPGYNPMYFYFTKTPCIQPTATVSIVKTANVTMAHVGDVIEYSFNVTNTGNVELTGVYINDNLTGRIDIGDLGPGEWTVVKATHTVSGSDPDPLVNNATVYAYYDSNVVYAWDTWTVDILHPAIAIEKSADKDKAYAGDTITYTYTVTNPGDTPLKDVTVVDDVAGAATYVSGDTDGDGWLDMGETWIFTATYTVKAGDPDPLVNNATASGKDITDYKVTATDTATVDLIAKICGYKFYDANANGVWDDGEQGLSGWTIELWQGDVKISETTTGSDGSYCFDGLDAGEYMVKEVAQQYWICTTSSSITVKLQSGEISENNNFGNVCLMPGTGGKTLGFWSNKNGQALITSGDLGALNALDLHKPKGWTYPPFTDKTQIKNYLLNATAVDMRWMLSAQLIATELNVRHGFLSNSTIVYVGPSTYVPSGFISIKEIMENANSALAGTDRAAQEYWKNLLDGLNNNWLPFVCPEPCSIVYP
jgi:uncharacterized repeat protein (TIGR01451 family)